MTNSSENITMVSKEEMGGGLDKGMDPEIMCSSSGKSAPDITKYPCVFFRSDFG